jgi:hypothetical protein
MPVGDFYRIPRFRFRFTSKLFFLCLGKYFSQRWEYFFSAYPKTFRAWWGKVKNCKFLHIFRVEVHYSQTYLLFLQTVSSFREKWNRLQRRQ